MMLAYRRGLLKPDYPNGLQSRLREHMVLHMLEYELTAAYFNRVATIDSIIYGSHIDNEHLRDFDDEVMRRVKHAQRRSEYDDAKYRSKEDENRRFDEQAQAWFAAIRKQNESKGEV